MYSTLSTPVLAERAQRAVSDPAFSPYSDATSDALHGTIAELRKTHEKHGEPTTLSVLRAMSLAILVDYDKAEADRARRRPTADEVEAARAARAETLAGAR